MPSKASVAIITTLVGCGLNNIFLEYIIKKDPGAGHLITFGQFLFIAIHGFIFTSKFGKLKPKLPLRNYLILVVMFFATSVCNNWAFNFNIPVPLHMIFRAGSLIANMIMGIMILKKKYTIDKYLSVAMITVGIIICTLYTQGQAPTGPPASVLKTCLDCDDSLKEVVDNVSKVADDQEFYFFWWTIGITLLTGALLLSARMGIYQESLYAQYGKHPEEALYYTHLYSLPGFLMYSSSILDHMSIASGSEPYELPLVNFGLPIIWILLFLNFVTQYTCISSVYVLTTECSSLTVTLVITLRKFLSLIFSIIYFDNPFTLVHWFGTFLVFNGTLLFADIPTKLRNFLAERADKSKKKIN